MKVSGQEEGRVLNPAFTILQHCLGASTSVVAELISRPTRSNGLQLVRRHLARPRVLGQLIAELLPFGQVAHSSSLDGADVNEHILPAIVGLNKAETFLTVEPLDRTVTHDELPREEVKLQQRQASCSCGIDK